MEEADEFLRDGVRFIERELFNFIEDRGVGDDCDIESEGDRCR